MQLKYGKPFSLKRYLSKLLGGTVSLLLGFNNMTKFIAEILHYIRLRYVDFRPRPDDIFIVTCPRSGTTWMQNIMYQLTTDGSIDDFVLEEFSPYYEYRKSIYRNYDEMSSPRIFKSHLPYRYLPTKTGKFIYIARDGRDVAISYYHSFLNENRNVPFEQFFDRFLHDKTDWLGGWFGHVREWYQQRNNPNVLFLKYEDLQNDMEGMLHKIIDFCELTVDASRLAGILERCSFAYMKANQIHFTPGFIPDSHIRKGKTKSWVETLSAEQNTCYRQTFKRKFGNLDLYFD